MAKTNLPLLPLPQPLILLPTARITVPVSKSIGDALLTLVQDSETQPVIAAVPVSSPDAPLHSWGTAARITRLIKPPMRNLKQPYLLSLLGVTRVCVVAEDMKDSAKGEDLASCLVEYPSKERNPTTENVVKFKSAALRLLEFLAKDTTQQSKRDTYNKVASMIEEVTEQRAPWMADVMVANVNGEYADKLGTLRSHLGLGCKLHDYQYSFLVCRGRQRSFGTSNSTICETDDYFGSFPENCPICR